MSDPGDFVLFEAELLDQGRFDDWLTLFAEDGTYWVPLQGAAQADPDSYNSLAYEDRLLLSLRVNRLKNPRAHSQHPRSTCQHVLQQPRILQEGPAVGELRLSTPFIYVECRGDAQLSLAGTYRHALRRTASGFLICQKRVDLIQPGRALPMLQLFI
jgi:3-phenylpropionate/cinnamic acid dioxygenase small subunit